VVVRDDRNGVGKKTTDEDREPARCAVIWRLSGPVIVGLLTESEHQGKGNPSSRRLPGMMPACPAYLRWCPTGVTELLAFEDRYTCGKLTVALPCFIFELATDEVLGLIQAAVDAPALPAVPAEDGVHHGGARLPGMRGFGVGGSD